MVQQSLNRLSYLCDKIPGLLNALSQEDFSHKKGPEKWSRKQILGHLIDSAVNNHQRFIRVQYEETPSINYDPDQWVALNNYDQLDSKHLVSLWTLLNKQLAEVIKNTPAPNLERKGATKNGEQVTLEWYIDDYVDHLEHHLKDLVSYE